MTEPLAVVFTYVPSEDRTYHTPFYATEDHPDPLSFAHAFCEAERERGDFGDDALWTVTGNDAANEIRKRRLLASLGIDD
jgi:hypothetical protein